MGAFALVAATMPLLMGNTTTTAEEVTDECPHLYDMKTVDATCTEKGYTVNTCTLCGNSYIDGIMDEKGHGYATVTIEPTCTNKGYTTYFCNDCGYEYTCDYVETIGHGYTSESVEATCTTEGYTLYACGNCGDNYKIGVVAAKGHHHEEQTRVPTCVVYGYTVHYCNDCGDRYVTDYVKPLGHDYETTQVEATADMVGYTKYFCRDCEYSYLSDFVTSGDNGYLQGETPDDSDESEQGNKEPSDLPDDGEQGEEHTHSYTLYSELKEDEKQIYVQYTCQCGEIDNDKLQITLTEENGGRLELVIDEKGLASYAGAEGNYVVEMYDENGETITYYLLEVKSDKPEQPTGPDLPDVPEMPDISEVPDENERISDWENEELKKEKNNSGLLTGLLITLGVLAVGGIVTLFIIKKKNRKEKTDL